MNSEIVVLLSTVATGIIALIGLCVRYSFLSKCVVVKVSCCPPKIEIHRDIPCEMRASEQNNNLPESPSNRNLSRV
jgi:hypothetical protein